MRVNESINRYHLLKSLSVVFVLVSMCVILVLFSKVDAQSVASYDTVSVNNAGTKYAVSFDNVVEIRDLSTHSLINTLNAHMDKVTEIEWSPNDSMLATGSFDETMIVWDSNLGIQLHVFDDYSAYILSIHWYPDNDTLIGSSGPEDNRFKVWKVSTGQLIYESSLGTIDDIAQNPVTGTISNATGYWITLIDSNTYERIGRLQAPDSGTTTYFHLAYHPNGNIIAGGMPTGDVDVWDIDSNAVLHQLAGSDKSLDTPLNQIRALSFTPDGQYLSSISGDGIVKVFDWATATVVSETQLNSVVTGADFASDGFTLVYATEEGLTVTLNAIDDDVPVHELVLTPEATEEP